MPNHVHDREHLRMTETCPKCQNRLPADAPLGLCPACLIDEGRRPETAVEFAGGSPASDQPLPEPAELAQLFPQLEILELLGQGGMGAVYKARQVKLDRLVALKILQPRFGADPTFAERFAREAQALARLNHANIVTVYDFGDVKGLYYFLMEFVDGVNLRQSMREKNLTPEQALAIIPQICEALQFAHDEGVVHRDVKPENVLLDKRGRVRIADFGLAKLLGRTTADLQLTVSHQMMGTLHYMAPEQMQDPLRVDHRADIYSLGVVFYELLTGDLPLGRFAPPSRKAEVGADLDQVVLRALEREPEHRYQRASEISTDLQTIGSRPAATPAPAAAPVAAVVPAGITPQRPEPSEQQAPVWPVPTLIIAALVALLALVTWPVPQDVRLRIEDPVRIGPVRANLSTNYDLSTVRNVTAFDSELHLHTPLDLNADLPNWLLVVAPLCAGLCAVWRATSRNVWSSVLQSVCAALGLAHLVLLMIVFVDNRMGVPLEMALGVIGLCILIGAPPVSAVRSLAPPLQLRVAAVGIGVLALLVGLVSLPVMLGVLALDSVALFIATMPFTAALWILLAATCYGAWSMFHYSSLRWSRFAAIVGQPIGIWALYLLAQDQVIASFAGETTTGKRQPAPGKPAGLGTDMRPAVRGPAIGLLVVGVLDIAIVMLCVLAAVIALPAMDRQTSPQTTGCVQPALLLATASSGQDASEFESASDFAETTHATMRSAWWTISFGILLLVHLPLGGLLILGSLQMMKLQNHGLAVFASIVAILPCHLGSVAGLPLGLWSLVTLLRPDVKTAFRENQHSSSSVVEGRKSI